MAYNLIHDFNEIENKYFEIVFSGLQVWPLVRENIFSEIQIKVENISSKNKSDKNQSLGKKIKLFLIIILSTIKYVVKPKRKVKYLFLNHPRKKLIDGKYYDIYTDPIISGISESYIVLEGLFQLKHLRPSFQRKVLFADLFDFWPRLLSFLFAKKLSRKQCEILEKIETDILEKFNVKIDLKSKVRLELYRAKVSSKWLKSLLKKLEPELIIEIVGYNRLVKHVNIAAKELNIKTIELQHGYISEQHPSYNFSIGINNVQTFPEYLGVWSDYYKDKMNPPIKVDNIIKCGFKYFDEQSKRAQKKKQNTILFISQGTIGNNLGKLAIQIAKKAPNQIVYKLHPGEMQDAKSRYLNLYNVNNLTVDDEKASDLYERILEAKVVVGVYSTALIEAASLGKKVIIVGLPGWEYFKELIEDESFPMHYSEAEPQQLLAKMLNSRVERKESQNLLIDPYDNSFLNLASKSSD